MAQIALEQMGARVHVFTVHTAAFHGPNALRGCDLRIPDLRAGATLVLAALAAEGTSCITGVEHVRRGYEDFLGKLRAIGARVEGADEITVFLPAETARTTVANLLDNGRIAVCFSQIADHRTHQLKGRVVAIAIAGIAVATAGCEYCRGKPRLWERSPSPMMTHPMPGTSFRIRGRFFMPVTSSHMMATKISPFGSSGHTSARS